MNFKQTRFISISLSPTLVKVAQVTSAGVVEKVAKKSVEKGAVDAALRNALSGFQTQKSGIICTVPGDVATAKSLEVPSTDHDEIESIIALQASRHTPFNKDEILTSYIKIGSPRPNFTRVLLVIVKRETVKEKLAILKAAGLSTDVVLFIPEGVARFYSKAFNEKKGDAPVALLDVNMQSTNFIVTAQGVPVMSRNIPVGIEHFAVDSEAAKQFVDEIRASVDTYEQEGIDRKPFKYYLTTNHMALAGLDVSLSEALAVKVETAPYLNFVKASKAVRDGIARDFSDDSVLDVIACGVAAAKSHVDLVPQEIKDQRSVSEKGKETFKAGVFIIMILFFVGGGLLSKVYFKDQFLKQNLLAKYSEQKQDVQNLEGMIGKTRLLRQYLVARQLPLEAVRELSQLTPEEIYLSNINIDEIGNVSIQGVSESMSRVFNFVTALEASPFFEGVKTKSTTAKKEKNKDVAAFELVFKLTPQESIAVLDAPPGKDVKVEASNKNAKSDK